jgi:hypothetical protein
MRKVSSQVPLMGLPGCSCQQWLCDQRCRCHRCGGDLRTERIAIALAGRSRVERSRADRAVALPRPRGVWCTSDDLRYDAPENGGAKLMPSSHSRIELATVLRSGYVLALAFLLAQVCLVAPARGSTVSTKFTFTGDEQNYTVPAGVTSIDVDADGGLGGGSGGGYAGAAQGTLAVSPGEMLYVEVGGSAQGATGGWNGGGNGGHGGGVNNESAGSGGGGASDIRTCSRYAGSCNGTGTLASRLIVGAGAGGSAGDESIHGSTGGYGGSSMQDGAPGYYYEIYGDPDTGSGGLGGGSAGTGGYPGNAANPAGAGGAGGVAYSCEGGNGANQSDGSGGTGGGGCGTAGAGGGGGGGGYTGGGGGGAGATYVGPGDAPQAIATAGGGAGGTNLIPTGGYAGGGAPVPSVTISYDNVATTISLSISPTSMPADGASTASATVTLANAAGLPVSGDNLTLTTTDPGMTVSPLTDQSDGTYTATVTSSANGPRSATLTATDTSAPATLSTTQTETLTTAKPVNGVPPAISGAAKAGSTLTESHGSWYWDPTDYSYQWQRCDASGGNCVAVDGAQDQTYPLMSADIGHTIRVSESASNEGGVSPPVVSDSTPIIKGPPAGGGGGSGSGGGGSGSGGGGSGSGGGGSGGTAQQGPTKAQVMHVLSRALTVRNNEAHLGKLEKARGVSIKIKLPGAGKLTVDWYLERRHTRFLIAAGVVMADTASTKTLRIRVSSLGRQRLRHVERVKLTLLGSFAPKGEKPLNSERTQVFTR